MRRASFLFWLDLVLLLTFALLQEPETTGLWGHEWISIGLSALLIVHLLVNWRWIVGALRRYATSSRRHQVNAWLNGLLYSSRWSSRSSPDYSSSARFVLPSLGLGPSEIKIWRQLHSFVAGVTLAVLGLHVAINWDWIANVIRRWRRGAAHPEPAGGRFLAQRRWASEGVGRTLVRVGKLVGATAVICGLSYLPVAALAQSAGSQVPETRWAHPDFGDIPAEMLGQVLVVAGAAVVGSYVF